MRLTFHNKDVKVFSFSVEYIEEHGEVEDVSMSGGDTYLLPGHVLLELDKRLLAIDYVRRLRCTTKGLSVMPMPMTILTDHEWFDSMVTLSELARAQLKSFVIHTHINHPNEITYITKEARLISSSKLMFVFTIRLLNCMGLTIISRLCTN
jgi:L-lysine 2,3-aminomutase